LSLNSHNAICVEPTLAAIGIVVRGLDSCFEISERNLRRDGVSSPSFFTQPTWRSCYSLPSLAVEKWKEVPFGLLS